MIFYQIVVEKKVKWWWILTKTPNNFDVELRWRLEEGKFKMWIHVCIIILYRHDYIHVI